MLAHGRRFPQDVWWLLAAATAVGVWSSIKPVDYATWLFEIAPGAVGVLLLALISPRFRFSALVYGIVAVHFVILAAGAKYTYAEMPLFNWLRDALQLSRNHFDRVGHFFQGVTPALVVREVLLRRTAIQQRGLVAFLSVCVALAFSASYELLEWGWVVVFYPTVGPEWLGFQGDPWDAQGDMFMALMGALLVVTALARIHDRSIESLPEDCR